MAPVCGLSHVVAATLILRTGDLGRGPTLSWTWHRRLSLWLVQCRLSKLGLVGEGKGTGCSWTTGAAPDGAPAGTGTGIEVEEGTKPISRAPLLKRKHCLKQ